MRRQSSHARQSVACRGGSRQALSQQHCGKEPCRRVHVIDELLVIDSVLYELHATAARGAEREFEKGNPRERGGLGTQMGGRKRKTVVGMMIRGRVRSTNQNASFQQRGIAQVSVARARVSPPLAIQLPAACGPIHPTMVIVFLSRVHTFRT